MSFVAGKVSLVACRLRVSLVALMLKICKGEALARLATGLRGLFKLGGFAFWYYSTKAGISKLLNFAEANSGLALFLII